LSLIGSFITAEKVTDLAIALIQRRKVYANICEVRNNVKASSIKVPKLNSGTVGDYVPGTNMTTNNATSSSITIALDNAKYINDYLDYVDMAESEQDATKQCVNTLANNMGNEVDKQVLKALFSTAGTGGATYGLGVTTAPITIDSSNIDDYFADAARALDDADAPEAGRYAVITTKMQKALTLNNIYVAATTDEAARKGGFRGMFMGFEVYVSNNLPKGVAGGIAAGEAGVVFGVKGAGAVGFTYENTRTIPTEDRFGEKFQSVAKWGSAAVTPEYICNGCVVA